MLQVLCLLTVHQLQLLVYIITLCWCANEVFMKDVFDQFIAPTPKETLDGYKHH